MGPFCDVTFKDIAADDVAPLLPYDGWHFCIYVADFSGAYTRAAERNLVWNNLRFSDRG